MLTTMVYKLTGKCENSMKTEKMSELLQLICPHSPECRYQLHAVCDHTADQKWSLNVIILKKTRPNYEPPNCDYNCVMRDKMEDVKSGPDVVEEAIRQQETAADQTVYRLDRGATTVPRVGILCLPGYRVYRRVCIPCFAGSYNEIHGSDTCLPCRQGQYQDEPGTTDCIDCTSGKTTNSTGAVSIAQCIDEVSFEQTAIEVVIIVLLILLPVIIIAYCVKKIISRRRKRTAIESSIVAEKNLSEPLLPRTEHEPNQLRRSVSGPSSAAQTSQSSKPASDVSRQVEAELERQRDITGKLDQQIADVKAKISQTQQQHASRGSSLRWNLVPDEHFISPRRSYHSGTAMTAGIASAPTMASSPPGVGVPSLPSRYALPQTDSHNYPAATRLTSTLPRPSPITGPGPAPAVSGQGVTLPGPTPAVTGTSLSPAVIGASPASSVTGGPTLSGPSHP